MRSLLMKEGPLAGKRYTVDAELVIGRVNADLTIDDPQISRRHALIRPSGPELEVEDLGSLNGTWLNGKRITVPRRLEPGDEIRIGKSAIAVEGERFEPGRTIVAPNRAGPQQEEPEALAAAAAVVRPAPAPAPPAPQRPRPAGRAPEGRRDDELRLVTALFADIVGSTGLGERLTPDAVKVVIGECVSRMTGAVERFGGTVQAYMGDGIAAFFGLPSAHEDDPERAARAALAILDVVREHAREVEAAWGISDFNARVGINTGETGVGLVGSADPQSVALGDMTNVAARLQSAAAPGTIAVGQATARCLVKGFVLEPLGEISVKGRDRAVEAWTLVCAQTAAQSSPLTPLVGRRREVERLKSVLDELVAGRGQILGLIGESGIGKTRLLAELRVLAADHVTWLEGRCLSYGAELAYGPLIEMLRGWIGAEEGEADLSVRTKLRAKLGLLPASEVAQVLPYLSRLLSVRLDPDDDERLRRLPPEELAMKIRRAYRLWVQSLARQAPVVVAVEDVHWADPSSRELLEELLELCDVAPLLMIATVRPDTASEGWRLRMRVLTDFAHRSVEVALGPLDDTAARELLAGRPRSTSLLPQELDQIVAGAEGNPLYLEELLNAFTDTGDRGRTWAPTLTERSILTPALESLLLARIDRLPDKARRFAQVAALVGRSFPRRVLEHVSDTEDLDADLAALLRADIIREVRRYPEAEYTFKHGLLRQASLSTLPPARRRELYAAVGSAFETLFAGSVDDHLEVLANYFARSHDLAKALEYLERAGEKAANLDAVAQAAELWRRALRIAEKQGDTEAEARLRSQLDALEARSGERIALDLSSLEDAKPEA